MTGVKITPDLTPTQRQSLARAIQTLENPNFAAKLADYAGRPLNRVLRILPGNANHHLNRVVETVISKCMLLAIDSLEDEPAPAAPWFSSAIAGLTGGVSGAFGLAALPVELPLTTTLMLRAIADIARREGEDLSDISARLACLEVFALGAPRTDKRRDVGYFAARAMLSRLTNEASAFVVERGVTGASAPVIRSFVAEIASRFGLVVSDRAAASAIPLIGAVGGATVNVIFMDHFQRIAQSHFTIRRLERQYGAETIQRHWAAPAGSPSPSNSRL